MARDAANTALKPGDYYVEAGNMGGLYLGRVIRQEEDKFACIRIAIGYGYAQATFPSRQILYQGNEYQINDLVIIPKEQAELLAKHKPRYNGQQQVQWRREFGFDL